MAKRFSDTDKWKDEWFSGLTPIEKLTFLFIVDNCDNAGFFELNTRLNSYLIGISIDEYNTALNGLSKGMVKSNDGKKCFIKNFLFHQKNTPLNLTNNAHKQIINIIKTNLEYFDFDFDILAPNQGLFSPLGKGIGKGKVEYTAEIENLLSQERWVESFCMKHKIKPDKIRIWIESFCTHLASTSKIHPNEKEWKEHFNNWTMKQPKTTGFKLQYGL